MIFGRFLRVLTLLLLLAFSIELNAQNSMADMKENGNKFVTNSKSFFGDVKNGAVGSSLNAAGTVLKNTIDEALNGADSPLRKLEEGLKDPNISAEELTQLLADAKEYIKNFKDEVLKKNAQEFLNNNDFLQQADGLVGQAGDLLKSAQSLLDYGYGFNAPIGFQVTPNEDMYFSISMDSIVFSRDPNDQSRSYTKGRLFVQVALKFLPKQEDSSHCIAFSGDVVFKKGDESVKSRIYLDLESMGKEEYRIPFVKEKMDLVFVDALERDKTDGNCTSHSGERTYIEFDCNGITDFNMNGYIDFKRSMLVPMEYKDITDKKDDAKDEDGKVVEKADYSKAEKHKSWVAMKEGKTVKAHFNIKASHGPCVSVCFNHPFSAACANNFVWEVHESIFDFSTKKNAPGFSLPTGYLPEDLDEINWTGIYLKQVTCHFPEDFKLNDTDEIPEASVYDVFIDDYGFTAKAKVKDIINKGLGNSGARIRVQEITAEVYQSKFISGSLTGSASIPFLRAADDETASNDGTTTTASSSGPQTDEELEKEENGDILTFGLHGRVDYNEETKHYLFDARAEVGFDKKYKVPFTEMATISVNKGTGISLTNYRRTAVTWEDENGNSNKDTLQLELPRMRFELTLNGSLDINSLKSSKGSAKFGYDCQFDGIAFEGLKFSNVGTKVSIKHLALKGKAQARFLSMKLGIDSLSWTNSKFEMKKSVTNANYGGLDVKSFIELVPSDADFGISPRFGAKFKSFCDEAEQVAQNVKSVADNAKSAFSSNDGPAWHFAGIDVNNIAIDMDFPAFKLKGSVDLYKDDEDYGKGFKGIVDLKLDPLDISANVQACFGSKSRDNQEPLKYWFTKANCSFSPGIPVFMNAKLRALTGGAYYHMSDKNHGNFGEDIKDLDAALNPEASPKFMFADVANYKPDETKKFGIILGAGFNFGSDNLATVNAELNMSFASCGALDKITLGGEFTMICPTPKFLTTVQGKLDQLKSYEQQIADKMRNDGKILDDLSMYLKGSDQLPAEDGKQGETKTGQMGAGDTKNGTIFGWACMEYNHNSKRFWLNSAVKADFGALLQGQATCKVLIEKGQWYFRLGTDTDPATLSFLDGFATAKTYFMSGVLPSNNLQPLSKDMEEKFTLVNHSNASDDVKKAKGIAFALNTKAHMKFDDFPLIFAEFGFEGGTDLLLRNCNYSYDGKDYKWRGQGSLYGYVAVDLGVKFFRHEWDVIEANSFAGFRGQLPAPVQGEGVMTFYVKVGGVIKCNADLRVRIGEKANIICN